jgi:hypothetical protein
MTELEMPPLVHDFGDRPVQLRALLALWDTSVEMLLDRLDGVTDEEWTWQPAPSLRSLSWSAIHLGELGTLRSDWTTGSHSLQRGDLTWPETAAEGVAAMRAGLDAWRGTLAQVDDDDLDTVGRSSFPDGLDPQLPLIDIAWWNTRELIHHGADMATVRDLYAATSPDDRQIGTP